MNQTKLQSGGDERAVAPVVGVVLVIGFVVLVALGLFIFGGTLITGSEDPREDANFELEFINQSNAEFIYDTGSDFDSQNTDQLFLIGENPDGEPIGEDGDGQVLIYDGSDVVTMDDPQGTIEEGDVLIENTTDHNIENGASLQVIWEPADRDDVQIVLDEIAVPDAGDITVTSDEEGQISGGTSINIEGEEPDEED